MFERVSIVSAGKSAADAVLVLGLFQPDNGKSARPALDPASARLDPSGSIAAAITRAEFAAELGRTLDVVLTPAAPKGKRKAATGSPARAIVVGLGQKDRFDLEAVRAAAAAASRKAAEIKARRLHVEAHLAISSGKGAIEDALAGRAWGEAVGLLACDFDEFRGKASTRPTRLPLDIASADPGFARGLKRGLGLAQSVNIGRQIGNTPPNIATPMWIARKVQQMGRDVGLRVRVFSGEDLDRHRLIGIRTVGQASVNRPCMIRIEYAPAAGRKKTRGADARPLVLVGKTLTYDTGGLSLKVNNGMRGMKGDKDGGCAVIGAMHAIATVIRPDRPVVGLLAAAENSVSDNAFRPDDIMTYRNGVTVEVTNTDAEGRLVLADALVWACREEKAAAVIDIATLTGGVVIALGSSYAGMWCDDDGLRAKVEASAGTTGERLWRLPIHREHRDMMKSTIADIINSSPERKAHPIQGAAFLSYFVEENVPWCHLDIAGVHRFEGSPGATSMFAKDTPTGFGARLMAEVAGRF